MEGKNGLMTHGNIAKQLIVFAIPLLVGNLFQQLYNTVDSIVVGNFIGDQALAAVNSSGPIIDMLGNKKHPLDTIIITVSNGCFCHICCFFIIYVCLLKKCIFLFCFRYSDGEIPFFFLNSLPKWLCDEKHR